MVTTDPNATAAEKAKADADKAAADKAAADRAAARRSDDKPARRGNLQPAGESGDPAVQKLLADRQAHVSNASTDIDPAVKEQRDAANKAIKEIDDKLADLGYSAK
jgi:hypothetical protein